jgi:hypothetical protein
LNKKNRLKPSVCVLNRKRKSKKGLRLKNCNRNKKQRKPGKSKFLKKRLKSKRKSVNKNSQMKRWTKITRR